jgi:dTDP-4-dehydrorhamnose 3,5-epimerase
MIISDTSLNGVKEIENKIFRDDRGSFIKTFNHDYFSKHGLEPDFKESFYSISKRNVLRGMHFQLSPHDHAKLVYVVSGEILDVAVDIRKDSPTFGAYHSTHLSGENGKSLYMERGFAHGFLTISKEAIVVYLTSSVYSPEKDTGIRWDCFGFNWGVDHPILSERDHSFNSLQSIHHSL